MNISFKHALNPYNLLTYMNFACSTSTEVLRKVYINYGLKGVYSWIFFSLSKWKTFTQQKEFTMIFHFYGAMHDQFMKSSWNGSYSLLNFVHQKFRISEKTNISLSFSWLFLLRWFLIFFYSTQVWMKSNSIKFMQFCALAVSQVDWWTLSLIFIHWLYDIQNSTKITLFVLVISVWYRLWTNVSHDAYYL